MSLVKVQRCAKALGPEAGRTWRGWNSQKPSEAREFSKHHDVGRWEFSDVDGVRWCSVLRAR